MSASTPNTAPDWLHVVAGVIRNPAGEILLTRRPDHVHQGGLWEFPGGKRETGESARQALSRELAEELGITVTASRPLIQVRHRYPDRNVLLDVFEVTAFQGRPHGREGQPLVWVSPDSLHRYELPAADRPIVSAIRLPPWYAILEDGGNERNYHYRFVRLLDRGIRLIYWRARDLSLDRYRRLAQTFLSLAGEANACLMLRSDSGMVPLPGTGLHLSSVALHSLGHRPPGWTTVSAACHTLDDLYRAERLELDFVTLSPIRPTPSHPDALPLGWQIARSWIAQVNLPVYLLGGLQPEDLPQARSCGAQGIAGIRPFLGPATGSQKTKVGGTGWSILR